MGKVKQDITPEQAEMEHREAFEAAKASGRWMAVVWSAEGDRGVHMRCVTSNFPDGHFAEARAMLKKDLKKKAKGTKKSAPELPPPLPSLPIRPGILAANPEEIAKEIGLPSETVKPTGSLAQEKMIRKQFCGTEEEKPNVPKADEPSC